MENRTHKYHEEHVRYHLMKALHLFMFKTERKAVQIYRSIQRKRAKRMAHKAQKLLKKWEG